MKYKAFLLSACAVAALGATAGAQNAAKPATPLSSIVEERHLSLKPDMTDERSFVRRWKLLQQSGATQVGQQSYVFIESLEHVDITGFTEKADGTRLPLTVGNILTRDINTGIAAMYQPDAKQRVLIFPGLEVGDTAVMQNNGALKETLFEGYYSVSDTFPFLSGVDSKQKLVLDIPKGLKFGVDVSGEGVESDTTVEDEKGLHRTIVVHHPASLKLEPGAVSPFDWSARVTVSNFKDYSEFGQAYGAKAWPKVVVSPEIAALAEKITQGIADKRQQAVAIDHWMKLNIRYVALYRALARVIPNDALTVLNNRYGDCKDKVTLMAALLQAKGIDSEQVLVNLGVSYELPKQPILGQLNHVILYIPAFDIYDDPTFTNADFGVLTPTTNDKPVIRVAKNNAVTLTRTPPMKMEEDTSVLKVDIKVANDGKITGTMEETSRGFLAAIARGLAPMVRRTGPEQNAASRLNSQGMPGTGIYLFDPETNLADPYVLRGNFEITAPWTMPLDGNRIIPQGMSAYAAPADNFFGTRWPGRLHGFACLAGKQVTEINMTFDESLPLPVVFKPSHVGNDQFTSDASYELNGRTYTIRRVFTATPKGQVCAPSLEPMLASALKEVKDQYNAMLRFN